MRTADNRFHEHLDGCRQCSEHPFALCAEGDRLLRLAAEPPEPRAITVRQWFRMLEIGPVNQLDRMEFLLGEAAPRIVPMDAPLDPFDTMLRYRRQTEPKEVTPEIWCGVGFRIFQQARAPVLEQIDEHAWRFTYRRADFEW